MYEAISTISLSNSAFGAGEATASDLGIMVVENALAALYCVCGSEACALKDCWASLEELHSGALVLFLHTLLVARKTLRPAIALMADTKDEWRVVCVRYADCEMCSAGRVAVLRVFHADSFSMLCLCLTRGTFWVLERSDFQIALPRSAYCKRSCGTGPKEA